MTFSTFFWAFVGFLAMALGLCSSLDGSVEAVVGLAEGADVGEVELLEA
jgi:hypothetical protein